MMELSKPQVDDVFPIARSGSVREKAEQIMKLHEME